MIKVNTKVNSTRAIEKIKATRVKNNANILAIETGKFDPSLKLVMKMTKHFNVPLEQIFIYEEDK